MIISHKYKFIFIKTRKTAGTSIEVFLSQYCGKNDIVTPIYPYVEPHVPRNFKGIWNPIYEIIEKKGYIYGTIKKLLKREKFYNHIPAWLVKARIPSKIWNNYYKFSVERNPWDKTLSHYHRVNYKAGWNMSFEEYIQKRKFCLNHPLYTDSNGAFLLDKVIKYESLNEELHQILNSLGIPFNGHLDIRAKTKYRKDRRSYKDIYTPEQKEIIENAFAKEIEMHNYTF